MIESLVSQLRQLGDEIPRDGCDWETPPVFAPPAKPNAIARFEGVAGFELPSDYRAFLATTESVVGMSIHNGYWIGGLDRLAKGMKAQEYLRTLGGELVAPIATDGGGNCFLMGRDGHVWRLDRETRRFTQVADSFTEFLERVVADWTAYVRETPDWHFLV